MDEYVKGILKQTKYVKKQNSEKLRVTTNVKRS